MRYKYCPQCGAKLIEKDAGDDGKVPFCEKCEKYWFDAFASCVITMVINEYDEILLIGQKYLSDEYMNFICGFMRSGENAEQAAAREVREEVGFEMDSLESSGTWWFEDGEMLMHGFIGRVKKQDPVLSVEVDSAIWVPCEEAEQYMYPDMPGNAQYGTYKKFMAAREKK